MTVAKCTFEWKISGRYNSLVLLLLIFLFALSSVFSQEGKSWVVFEGGKGTGPKKHIVFVSGDEEYRSEEALPALAKILAYRHGFRCTVLFAINPSTGEIDPDYQENIPGLEALRDADLMVMSLRFRELPEGQMSYILNYLNSGKPIIALRTSTHAFQYPKDHPYFKYSSESDIDGWEGGFGRQVLGETWVSHHGDHGSESTKGLINGLVQDHPILTDVTQVWGPTDVYGINDVHGDETVLLFGQSLSGMDQNSIPNYNKSILPIAWIKEYKSESGAKARIFTTTMGAAVDFESEGLRRLILNAAYWAMDLRVPRENEVRWVGEYKPGFFGFGDAKKGMFPVDYMVDDKLISEVMKEESTKPGIESTFGKWEFQIEGEEDQKGELVISKSEKGTITSKWIKSDLKNIFYENGHLLFEAFSKEEGPIQGDLKFEGGRFGGFLMFQRHNYKEFVEGVKKEE